jgi:hypothetical protein
MLFNNLESRHFTAADKTTINGLLAQLETAFANKTANLTPEERKKYGSINKISSKLKWQNSITNIE